VKERVGTVVLECPAALVPLLKDSPGVDRVVTAGDPLPPFDVHAPLMSLPRILRTTLETIPAPIPYVVCDPLLVERWRGKLATLRGYKVGIAWQGNPRNPGDRWRSIPLGDFAPLAANSRIQLVSLQKGDAALDAARMGHDLPLVELGPEYQAGTFPDTAAVMTQLDLVVTCDTAIAHLAGALGIPVWLALPAVADWRWMLDRVDSPWYPTMRLFR
jgi:hypothetical protein